MPMTKSKKGCWTCKARKVQCDEHVPTCRRCIKAGRACEGYGIRLSWPRDDDKRRAIRITTHPGTGIGLRKTRRHTDLINPFINATFRDIELYRYLSVPGALKPSGMGPPGPKLWRQPRTEVTHGELLHYFHHAAHHSLSTFDQATWSIRNAVLPMVLSGDHSHANATASQRALLYALLAFSSLRRNHGLLHSGAIAFKVAALEALSASAAEVIVARGSRSKVMEAAAAQHVAACMLLCAFEISLPTENSGEWLFYIRGAMEIAQRGGLLEEENQSTLTYAGHEYQRSLLDWVYFHDTLSRFTLSHWRCENPGATEEATIAAVINPVLWTDQYYPSYLAKRITPSLNRTSPYAVLSVLSEICDVLLDPSDPRSKEISYRDHLQALEWKIDSLRPATTSFGSSTCSPDPSIITPGPELAAELSAQIHWIATRVYLYRASQEGGLSPSPSSPSSELSSATGGGTMTLDSLISAAFAGPVRHRYCRHFFPLLIIACEARSDEHRADILALVNRTERHEYARRGMMRVFRRQVQAFWTQRDLHEDGERILDYRAALRAIISSDRALPSYV